MQYDIDTRSLMDNFARSTMQSTAMGGPSRYLWTDAFAVCNYLELYRQTSDQSFLRQAVKLVDQVHQILGRHRKDSAHKGWLCGLDDQQALIHPTKGGLRIGKQFDERPPGAPVNQSLEWEQDGQYFHYLTKWMHALNCLCRDTGKGIYNQWAIELAKTAHEAFTYLPPHGGTKRMYWKMSIDLSRPLVESMGQHDPLDGLIVYLELMSTAQQFSELSVNLEGEIADMLTMCAGQNWMTNDPLGIGGLLTDAFKLIQLIDTDHLQETTRLENILRDSDLSLQTFIGHHPFGLPTDHRLAFRELGLAIGLQTIKKMETRIQQHPGNFCNSDQLIPLLENLARFEPIHDIIQKYWLEHEHQSVKSWRDHAAINNVMLATCLAPNSYLEL